MGFLKVFYSREFYQTVFKTRMFKKGFLVLLCVCLGYSALIGIKNYFRLTGFVEVVKIHDFLQSIPPSWELINGEGLYINDADGNAVNSFDKSPFLRVDLDKDLVDASDMGEYPVLLTRKAIYVKNRLSDITQYDISRLEGNMTSIKVAITDKGISIFRDDMPVRTLTFADINKYATRLITIVFLILAPMLFILAYLLAILSLLWLAFLLFIIFKMLKRGYAYKDILVVILFTSIWGFVLSGLIVLLGIPNISWVPIIVVIVFSLLVFLKWIPRDVASDTERLD